MAKIKKEFWITNISKTNISLSDLSLTINAFATVNLLDARHYYFTEEQINESLTSGSLYRKRDKLIPRIKAPEKITKELLIDKTTPIPSRERSTYSIKQENYEELEITDEQFAEQNAELAEIDQLPLKK